MSLPVYESVPAAVASLTRDEFVALLSSSEVQLHEPLTKKRHHYFPRDRSLVTICASTIAGVPIGAIGGFFVAGPLGVVIGGLGGLVLGNQLSRRAAVHCCCTHGCTGCTH